MFTGMTYRREDGDAVNSEALRMQRSGESPLLFHKQLTGRRLYINSQIRFLVAAGIGVGALAGRYLLKIEALEVGGLLQLAALLATFNVAIFVFAYRYRGLERRLPVYGRLMGITHLSIGVDFLFLTAALWFVGGAKSPFQAFYLLHVVLAAVLLSPRAAYAHALFGYALFSGLVLGEWFGVIPTRFPVGLVNSASPFDIRFVMTVLGVQGMLMMLAVYLVSGLTDLLRRGEQQLRATNNQLEQMGKLQRDFLHIALHDLKAPVNAATMLLESMTTLPDAQLTPGQTQCVDRARKRLGEAVDFLHDFSVLAALDIARLKKQAKEIDIAALIRQVVAENEDTIRAHEHTLTIDAPEDLPRIFAIERLIHEAVANLVTNADKYTPSHGSIVVRARQAGAKLRIEVEDNGIGIALDDQKRLFQEFARIKRRDTPLGDVAGSGLGLSIVRRVIEAHGGTVGLVSELDKGSTFFIEMPV